MACDSGPARRESGAAPLTSSRLLGWSHAHAIPPRHAPRPHSPNAHRGYTPTVINPSTPRFSCPMAVSARAKMPVRRGGQIPSPRPAQPRLASAPCWRVCVRVRVRVRGLLAQQPRRPQQATDRSASSTRLDKRLASRDWTRRGREDGLRVILFRHPFGPQHPATTQQQQARPRIDARGDEEGVLGSSRPHLLLPAVAASDNTFIRAPRLLGHTPRRIATS